MTRYSFISQYDTIIESDKFKIQNDIASFQDSKIPDVSSTFIWQGHNASMPRMDKAVMHPCQEKNNSSSNSKVFYIVTIWNGNGIPGPVLTLNAACFVIWVHISMSESVSASFVPVSTSADRSVQMSFCIVAKHAKGIFMASANSESKSAFACVSSLALPLSAKPSPLLTTSVISVLLSAVSVRRLD